MKNQEIPIGKLLEIIGEQYVQGRMNKDVFDKVVAENKELKEQIDALKKDIDSCSAPD